MKRALQGDWVFTAGQSNLKLAVHVQISASLYMHSLLRAHCPAVNAALCQHHTQHSSQGRHNTCNVYAFGGTVQLGAAWNWQSVSRLLLPFCSHFGSLSQHPDAQRYTKYKHRTDSTATHENTNIAPTAKRCTEVKTVHRLPNHACNVVLQGRMHIWVLHKADKV